MRKMKKLTAILLSMVMTVLMAATAFAAENYSITITTDQEGHTYDAYQIFKGDVADDNVDNAADVGPVLSNIQWGDDIDDTAGLIQALIDSDITAFDALTADSTAADVAEALVTANDAAEFAEIVVEFLDSTPTGSTDTYNNGEYVIEGLPSGYYLIDDSEVPAGGSGSEYIVQVLGNVKMKPKDSGIPEIEKKVKEDSRTSFTTPYGYGYYEVADYDIGQTVDFKIFGSIPTDLDKYDTYTYTFHDTMSKGLTLIDGEYIAYLITDTDDESGTLLSRTDDYTFTPVVNDDGTTTITIDIKDIKGLSEKNPNANYIMVKYQAKLNNDAQVGTNVGNPNEVYLEFSNVPGGDGTGKTEKEYVIVFTYTLHGDKVNGAYDDYTDKEAKLEDAEFVLLNADGTQVAKIQNYSASDYSTNTFIEWVAVTDAEEMSYEEWEEFNDTNNVIMVSNGSGAFIVNGIDEGKYKLLEVKAPEGFNKLPDAIELVITSELNFSNTFDYDNNPVNAFELAAGETPVSITADNKPGRCENDGRVSVTIVNNNGATLPETGGMGTTIFRVVGGLMIVCAGVLLVVRYRMRSNDR